MAQHDYEKTARQAAQPSCPSGDQPKADYFECVLDHISEAIITTDLEFIVTGWNKTAEAVFGHKTSHALGLHLYELLDLRLASLILSHTYPEYLRKKTFVYDHTAAFTDQAPAELSTAVSLMRDKTNRPFGYVCVTTPARRAEEPKPQPDYTGSDYLEILDSDTEGSWIVNLESRLVTYSPCWARRMGMEHPTANYREVLSRIVHPDDCETVGRSVEQTAAAGISSYKLQYRQFTVDKGYIWALVRGRIFYANGRPYKIMGTVTDISEMKEMERQLVDKQEALARSVADLQAREQEYLMLAGTNEIGFFVEDLTMGTVRFSPQWMKPFGLNDRPPKEHQIHIETEHYPAHFHKYRKVVSDCIQRGESNFILDLQIPVPPSVVYVSVYGRILFDENGKPLKVIGLALDMSNQKKLEIDLRSKAAELERKGKLVTEFFTNISHEFRTPLAIILMANELLESLVTQSGGDACAKATKYIAMLRQNSLRLQRLISNLLDITKIDAGLMSVNLVSGDLVPLLQDITQAAASFARPLGIEVAFLSIQHSCPIALDTGKVERMLLNLLSNAIKHTRPGGHVGVHLKVTQSAVTISVADDGDGIPLDRRDVLFNRFRQVNDSLTRASEGCGMGLALTKALAELLGGSVRFESEPGRGSVFYIDLPNRDPSRLDPSPLVGSLTADHLVELEFSDITRDIIAPA